MLNRKSSIILLVFLLLLTCFDAMQQKYYVDSFNLVSTPIAISTFLVNHIIRWAMWLITAIPFMRLVRTVFLREEGIDQKILFSVGIIIPFLIISLFTITGMDVLYNGLEVTGDNFIKYLTFFFYQKGLTFFLAYVGLMFWTYLDLQAKTIEAHWTTIEELKKSREMAKNQVSQITVKQGNHTKPLPIKEIIWIQADDYCVRIHTADKSYYLRKSLKFLEKELSSFGFVRVHRGALLNLNFLDYINFDASTLKLQDQTELPLSKSGLQVLRQRIKEESI